MSYILGISAFYHDSAACLIRDGEIIAAAQEERFTRKKHDASFPKKSIEYCLKEAKISPEQIDYVSFYDKPFLKFERLLETYFNYAPRGILSFVMAMPVWLKEKLFLSALLDKELNNTFHLTKKNKISWHKKLVYPEHHQSHAASAFYPSPFDKAAILTLDGVGEWATTSISVGNANKLDIKYEIHFPHSLGLLYSAFTYYTGFKVNSGEYKVMGLAPYGQPKYKDIIYKYLIDVKDDGSYRLNMEYFNYCVGLTMTNKKFNKLFGGKPRKSETEITQREMDLARSVQEVIEEVILKIVRHTKKITGETNLCLAGGVALNCVSNGKILKENIFDNIWIQPAAGDSGSAVGSALAVWYQFLEKPRNVFGTDCMKGSYIGPNFSNNEIKNYLNQNQIPFEELSDDLLVSKVSELLAQECIVGWFQGRMEFGPRALGGRSILGDARSSKTQSVMNLKIKHRESFRPFAPSVTQENVDKFFDIKSMSPYMLLVAPVNKNRWKELSEDQKKLWGLDLLNIPRSDIPAVTHVDYSARVQTVDPQTNNKYYKLLKSFEEKTGYPILVNTSFNVRGEPIVCKPEDAYRCFMRTDMDYLVLENFVLDKKQQKNFKDQKNWKKEFTLD